MKCLLASLVIIFSQVASASNFIEKKLQDDPTTSPREVLRLAYEAATDELNVYYIGTPESNCVISNLDYEDTLDTIFLSKFVTIKPEVPGKGPLFPGTPAIYKTGLVLLQNSDGTLPEQGVLNQYFGAIDVNSSYAQFDTNFQGSFSYGGILSEKLSVRRTGLLYVFSREIEWSYRPGPTVQYGYCWR